MKIFIINILAFTLVFSTLYAQDSQESNEKHITKLELGKKKKELFRQKQRDSTLVLYIDTLIMKDKSSLQFFGLKDVKIIVKHAEIGKQAIISGMGSKNNASNFDIDINLQKLGSLFVIARGYDAMNGTRTHPNGDGGIVNFNYDKKGLVPQTENKEAANYLFVDVTAGGRFINAQTDLRVIYDRISMNLPRVSGLPQGQIYSGSPGKEGEKKVNPL